MNTENDSQQATSAEEQSTAQTQQEAQPDYKALYLQEIENSKKQRAGKQTAAGENDKLQAKINQFEEEKMIQEGKQSELIDKLKADNKDLSGYKDKYTSYLEQEKTNILEQFPEEDREELANKDLDTLKYIQKKTLNQQQPQGNHIPNIPSMVKNNTPAKPFSEMNDDERKLWHNSVLMNKKQSII